MNNHHSTKLISSVKPFKIKPWKKFEYCNFSVCLDQDQSLRKMLIHPHHHHIWKSLYFYLSMDTPIYLPTMKFLVQTFILEKVWLEDTLPTYSLDICPKFRRFFLLDPLLTLFQVRKIFAHLWSVTEALQFYKGFQGCSFKAPVL